MRIEGKILSNLAVTGVTVALMGRYSKNLQGTLLQGIVATVSSIALPLLYKKAEIRFTGALIATTGALFIAGHLGGLSQSTFLMAVAVNNFALTSIRLMSSRPWLCNAAMALPIAMYLAVPSLRMILIGTVTLSLLQACISTSALTQEELVNELKKLNNQTLTPKEFKSALKRFNLLHPQYRPSVLKDIKVNGNLHLWGQGLTSLPTGLTIHGNLDLSRCIRLTSLPVNLTIDGDLDLSNCRSLTSLPNWITQLGPKADGSVRHVYLTRTELSIETIDRLRQENPVGMQFHFDLAGSGQPVSEFESIEAAISFWEKLLPKDHGIDKVQLEIEKALEKQFFMRYLARLKGTAEHNNPHTRSFLAQRIVSVIKTMEKDAELATFAISKMYEALISCDDGIIHTLDLIEEQILISDTEKTGDAEKLRELGIRFFKLDLMHTKIRKDIIPSMHFFDKVEVDLAFELGLNERLNLPRQTKNMIFRTYADVTDDQIDTVGNQVLNECTNEAIEDYLSRWSPWQRHLRRQEVAQMTYEQLPSVQGKGQVTCIINHTTTDQPVVVPESEGTFDYEALKKRYIECPEHPCSNQVFRWSDVRRIIT